MKKDASNRRNIVKNIAIVFLAVMLVLTFFSNTILNYSLPEVAVQYPMYGTISSRIRGQGTVTANQTYQVYFDESRIIEEVYFRRGDIVKKGDILYLLKDAPSDELNNAINTLTTMKINYQRKLMESTPDYTVILEEIAQLNKQLIETKQIKSNLNSNRALLISIQTEIDLLNKSISELSSKKTNLETYLNSLEPDTSLSEDEFLAALRNASIDYENAKTALDTENENLKELQRELVKMANPLLVAQANLDAKEKEKENYMDSIPSTDKPIPTSSTIMEMENKLYSAENPESGIPDPAEISRLRNKLNSLIAKYFEYKPTIDQYDADISLLTEELNDIQRQRNEINTNIEISQNRIDVLQFTFEDIEAVYLPLKARYEYEDIEIEIQEVSKTLLESQDELRILSEEKIEVEGKIMTESEADELIAVLEKSLYDKQQSYEKQKAEDVFDQQLKQIELQNMKREIEVQEALVERLSDKVENNTITAPVSGALLNMRYVAGEKTEAGGVAAEIEISEKGYTMSFSVTVEQARRISVGQQAEIQYYYGSTAPYAQVTGIQTDYNNPQSSRIIVLEVIGDNIYPGQALYVALGETGRDFETVVPNSAVHEDNKGKFVYIVEAKNTPIGNRYIAKRVDIQVIASDDKNSAISGISAYANYVITTASKPLTDGMQVRLVEE